MRGTYNRNLSPPCINYVASAKLYNLISIVLKFILLCNPDAGIPSESEILD